MCEFPVRICRIEATRDLAVEFAKLTGRYWEYFLYRADEEVYLCEFTPSYWLECVGFETENTISEYLSMELEDVLHDSSTYKHVKDVERTMNEAFGNFESMDDAVEHYRSNPIYITDRAENNHE